MHSITILIASVLSVGSPMADAQSERRWTAVGETETYSSEADMLSIRRSGQIRNVWERKTFFGTQQNAQGEDYQSMLNYWRFDCSRNTFQLMSSIFRGNGGRVIRSEDYSDLSSPNPIPPESIAESLGNLVCA